MVVVCEDIPHRKTSITSTDDQVPVPGSCLIPGGMLTVTVDIGGMALIPSFLIASILSFSASYLS